MPAVIPALQQSLNRPYFFRVTIEHARGPRRDMGRGGGGGGGDRDRRGRWVEKYGPPTRTDYRVIVENLSSRVSWQVILR